MAPLSYLFLPWRLLLAYRNAKIITVEPVIFLLVFARQLYKPLYEQYYYVDYGLQTLVNTSFPFPNGSFCLNSTEIDKYAGNGTYKIVETNSNHLLMYGQLADRLPSMVVTIFLGPLSDRFGRRFLIVAPALGAVLQSALSLTIVHFQWSPYYFILANFLTGITGGFVGVLAGGYSYIADVSSVKWRGFRIGVIEAVLGVAAALGTFVTGYWLLLINCDFIPPLWLTLGCNVGAVVYVLLLLPESLTPSEREEMGTKNHDKGCKKITRTFKIFIGKAQYRSTWKLWFGTLFIGIIVFSFGGFKLISVYFLKALPFDFNPLMIGYYQSAQSVSRAVCNIIILPVLLVLGMSDAAVALVGLVMNCSCNLLTGFADKTWQVFTIVAFQGSETLEITAGRTILSKLVAPEDQGAIFAVIAACEALAALLSGIVWPIIFPLTLNHDLRSGTTFFLTAGVTLCALPLIVSLLVFHRDKLTSRESNKVRDDQRESNAYYSHEEEEHVSEHSSLLQNNRKTTINQ